MSCRPGVVLKGLITTKVLYFLLSLVQYMYAYYIFIYLFELHL